MKFRFVPPLSDAYRQTLMETIAGQGGQCVFNMNDLVARGVYQALLCSCCHMSREPFGSWHMPRLAQKQVQPLVLSGLYVKRFPDLVHTMPRRLV